LARELSQNQNFKKMKKPGKILIGLSLSLMIGTILIPSKAEASCPNAYDVTYPSVYCDPAGYGSCIKKCPGNP
jgi:hypothetical protein